MTIPKVPNSSQHIVSFPAGAEGAGGKNRVSKNLPQ